MRLGGQARTAAPTYGRLTPKGPPGWESETQHVLETRTPAAMVWQRQLATRSTQDHTTHGVAMAG